MKSFLLTVVAACTLVVVGCTPADIEVEQTELPAAAEIKQSLQSTVANEQLGSEMMVIDNALTELAADDASKAAELRKDFEALKKAEGPKVKTQAQAMIDKLN